MDNNSIMLEEEYEKCRALISVLVNGMVDDDDRITLIAILEEEFSMLGKIIGIVR